MNKEIRNITIIALLVAGISILHYSTSTANWQYHLIYMQAYFIPIILGAFQFGVRGGLGTALFVSLLYFPHIMMHWGGLIENNLMRFLQIILFNVLGYLTGLKSQGERKEKEKFQEAAQKLQKAMEIQKEQSEKLFEMEQQLRAADRLAIVGELTASLAHEVRNPLGSIRGAVEIIRDAVPEDVKKLEFFDILIQDTQRLNQVVENYLSFAKKQTHNIRIYDLKEIINNIKLMIGARIRKSRIKLKIHIHEKTLVLKGDPNHIWQAVMNVILNALQAMPDGGGINIKAEKKSAKMIRLVIQDQGTGIDSEKLARIFDTFYTTRKDGSGLGLAIVRRLADENNWKIKINSKPDIGTEFTFLIPINEDMK